ncbi:MAG: hypothetical protein ACHQRK_03695, partial [Gemmatimonadales bacterium]
VRADRAELENAVAEERARLERAATEERARLQRTLEDERAALVAKREELERTVAEQRAEMERAAAADRRQIERLRAELKRAGELEIEKKRQAALEDISDDESSLDREELAPPSFLTPVLAPLPALAFDEDSPLLSDDAIDLGPPRELDETLDEVSASSKPIGPTTRQRWAIVSAAVVGILAVAGISAAVIARHGPLPASATTSATSAGEAAAPIARTRAVTPPVTAASPARPESLAAGNAAPDSTTTLAALQWMDSVRSAHPLQAPPVAPPRAASSSSTPTSSSQPQQSRAARDTLQRQVIQSVTDSIFDFRRVTPAKRDSSVRRDSLGRPVIPRPR